MIANLSSIIFASWRILPECFMMQNESSQPPRRRKTRPPVASPALAHPVRHSSTLIKGSPVEIPVGIWHGREKNLQRIQRVDSLRRWKPAGATGNVYSLPATIANTSVSPVWASPETSE
jgi:hypothetical protein